MTPIGETLRRERLRRNLALDEISRELKISSKFLEAIEDERFEQLPGGVFARSFVRQYARLLGLDEEELAGELQRTLDPTPAGPQFAERPLQPASSEIHVPRVEGLENVGDGRFSRSSSLPSLALVVVVMLVCSGVYAWWQRTHRPVLAHQDVPIPVETTPARQVEAPPIEVPQRQAPQTEAQAQAAVPATRPQSPQPPPSAQNAATRPAGDAGSPAKPSASAAFPSASATPPAPAAGQESGAPAGLPAPNPNAPVQVAVTAEEPVWVLAKTDGKFSFSGTLEANQTRMVEANDTVLLRLGNAGGVTIKLNGKPVGTVGPKGQVRTVQFTSGGFQIVVPPKPSFPLDDLL